MLERLGLVCYWVGCALAVLFVISGVVVATQESHDKALALFLLSGIGGLCWIIGRAIKFVLSGQ